MFDLSPNTTVIELLVAILGLTGIGFSAWAAVDDLCDLSVVRREGVVGGPRWISARGYLGLNLALFFGWLGYTAVALIVASLPSAASSGLSDWTWGDIASVARLEYGGAVLTGQILQRITRTVLRRLPRSAWDAFFGEATLWRDRYMALKADLHEAQANTRHLEAEVATHRAEKHAALNAATRADLRLQQLQRWLRSQNIVPPDFSTAPEPA